MVFSSFAVIGSTPVQGDSEPVPTPDAEPVGPEPQWDWNPWTTYNGTTVYHSFSEMETEIFWIAETYPHITKLVSIGKSWQGRDIWAMKVSDNPYVEEEDEPEVYFNSNHHAREWLTIENALYFLRYLTNFYGSNATVTNIVDTRQIWVIPTANPDGRVYDSAGDDPAIHARQPWGWRKNTRDNDNSGTFTEAADGVDLNRNYGYLWGAAGATSDPIQDVYGGPYPFSEPETAAIRDFCRQHDFVFAISFHSYSQLILYPWGWSYENAPDHDALKAVAENMAGVITNKAGSQFPGYTPQKSSGLYPTAGSDDDWLYGELGTFAYCIEMYPNVQDDDNSAYASYQAVSTTYGYDLFHPRSDKVIPACQDNLPAVLLLCTLADNRFQLIDHVEIDPETAEARIPAGTSANVLLDVTDNGRRADSFTISRTTISGWTINVTPSPMSLARNETKIATLSVTVPAGATPGFYNIWVNATSTTNSSCRDSSLVTIEVPHPDDVAPLTLEPFTEMGDFPKGQYRIDSLVENVGEIAVPNFNTTLTISQLGVGSTVTVFQDNMDVDGSKWEVINHDGAQSNAVWHRQTARSHTSPYSWYCAPEGSTSYNNNIIQSLQMAQPVSLERYTSATLSFFSRYTTEEYWDFCMVEGSRDNGKSWDYIIRYNGNGPTSFTEFNLNLSQFLGTEQFKLRFRFTSDDYNPTTYAGFYLDTLTITASDPSETVIFSPPALSVSPLAVGASQELSWTYNFTDSGTYLASVETLHANDSNAANNVRDVMFYINNSRTLPEFEGIKSVTNPGMGPSLEIAWGAGLQINDPLTYRVYRFDHAPTLAEVNAATPIYTGTALEYTDSSVVLGQTYYYVVRMVDAFGQAEYNVVTLSGTPGISVDQWGLSNNVPVVEGFQASNGGGTTSTNLVLTAPSGITAGELLLLIVCDDYANTATHFNAVTGWTKLGESGSATPDAYIGVYWRIATGTEGSSQTVTSTAAAYWLGWYLRISGADTTAPINAQSFAISSATGVNPHVIPQITTTVDKCLAIYGLSFDGGDGALFSVASPWTESAEQTNGATTLRNSGCWGTKAQATAGATGTASVTCAQTDGAAYFQLAIRPLLVATLDDNTVNWTSAGEDVAYYNIYRSDSPSGPWDAAHRIATVGADTLTYCDLDRGQADSIYWWYVVRAIDGYGTEETNTNAVQEPGAGWVPYSISLTGKLSNSWVFVSYPVTVSGHIEAVINDTLNGDGGTDWDVAKTWDNQLKKWLTYRKGGTANTFTDVDNRVGIWLHLTSNGADQMLELPSTGAYPGVMVINLYTGWNLVGYPSGTSRMAPLTLPGLANIVSEWQSASPYILDKAPGDVMMAHGNGYWVHVTADCTWTLEP
jgi:hypothetical protein